MAALQVGLRRVRSGIRPQVLLRSAALGLPLALVFALIVCPLVITLIVSFWQKSGFSMVPAFTLDNYADFFSGVRLEVLLRSLWVAFTGTCTMLLIAYPILLEGSFTVVDKNPTTNLYETHVGLILTTEAPCYGGYESTDTRPPQNVEDRPLNQNAKCTEPPTKSNPRGFQNLPRVRPDLDGIPDANERIIGTYDRKTGTFEVGDGSTSPDESLASSGSVAPPSLGEDSWKWLYLEPLLDTQG